MTNYDDEEKMILDKVLSARHAVTLADEQLKRETASLRLEKQSLEKYRDECEQALIDFYKSCGVTSSKCGDFSVSLSETKSVEISDIASVPERYLRVKTVTEINKALIKAENLPPNNWLSYKTDTKLTIKHRDS